MVQVLSGLELLSLNKMEKNMAFKDTLNKMVSYFDTDGVSEMEETSTPQKVEEKVKTQKEAVTPNQPHTSSRPVTQRPVATEQKVRQYPNQSQARPTHVETMERRANPEALVSQRRDQMQQVSKQEQTTIALKYPKKYEDAQEIVDLLIVNECVLIDFQFMLDAQARRCLDFIDGASKVLYGTLQKVGSSMYLLTPSNVSVNIEDMNIPNSGKILVMILI